MFSHDVTLSGATVLLLTGAMGISLATLILLLRRQYKRRATNPGYALNSDRMANRNKYVFANIFRLSNTFFKVGLVVALGLVVLAFSWTTYEEIAYGDQTGPVWEEDLIIIPRTITPPPLPPPTPPAPKIVAVEELPEEQPDFLDGSIDVNEAVIAPAAITQKPDLPIPPPPMFKEEAVSDLPFKVVEEMPRFPGCEGIYDKAEKQKCSDKNLLTFIGNKIKYPAIARENNIEGTVVIQFVVEKDGTISDTKIVRDIGGTCGAEALRVVNLMNKGGIRWEPGKQRARPVRVQFNLPVRFKLSH